MISREEFLNKSGTFLWAWNHKWIIKTDIGCFLWSDGDYPEGKNTIQKYDGDESDFLERTGTPYFRDKGNTFIKNRVPENVELIEGEIK